jgi:hypothetical protein
VFTGHGGAGGNPEQVNMLVWGRAAAKAAKLGAAGGDEAHLFVWVDGFTYPDAELGMATMGPPQTTPTVPPGIDVAWAATVGSAGLAGRPWRLEPPGNWEVIG